MKILVVEDEKLLAESIRTLLQEKGFEADAVYDGEAGVDYAESGVYDLIILDVMMPKMNGYQVAKKAEKHPPEHPDLNAYSEVRAPRPCRRPELRRRLLPHEAL